MDGEAGPEVLEVDQGAAGEMGPDAVMDLAARKPATVRSEAAKVAAAAAVARPGVVAVAVRQRLGVAAAVNPPGSRAKVRRLANWI